MAESCKQQQERIETSVLQPIDQWVSQQEQRCRDEPCNWWTLCLNKLFCWLVVAVVKVTLWVLTIVVRWVYRLVCTIVMLVIGVLALLVGNTAILGQAGQDLWELVKDGTYAAIGVIIFAALRIVDLVQSVLGIQPAKRRLTEAERALLWPIFRNSLNYNAIEVVDGSAGLLTITGAALTMGFTIYLPSYSEETLVHECVHVWQFEFEGFRYIGNSTLNQLDHLTLHPGYDPYIWQGRIDAGASWYTLKSVEAQAQFIADVWNLGIFQFDAKGAPEDKTDGAFFRGDPSQGHNLFAFGAGDYTVQANAAWQIIRTG